MLGRISTRDGAMFDHDKRRLRYRYALALGIVSALPPGPGACVTVASRADRAFVATVLQGGTFEIEAGRLASAKAAARDVRDLGDGERHDYERADARLRAIAGSAGISFGTRLHPRFRQRLRALAKLSGQRFDDAFVADMEAISTTDGAAFARETEFGTDRDLRAFAAGMVRVVRRHAAALRAIRRKG